MTDEPTPYELLGGERAVRALVDRFYDLMDTRDDARTIRAMHPASLQRSRDKLFMFLSGWLGGPQLYWETYGHPRLRMRHISFAIDQAARDAWVACMLQALEDTVEDEALRAWAGERLAQVATHMINREG